MASNISKHKTASGTYWRFCFTSSRMAAIGQARQKWFTFNADRYKKSDVERIRDEYEMMYRSGQWDPWHNERPESSQSAGSDVKLSYALQLYSDHIPRVLAKKTVQVHTQALNSMVDFLGSPAAEKCLEMPTIITDWVNGSDSWNTRRSRKYYADRFFRWCHDQGYLSQGIITKAYSTKEERNTPAREAITQQEMFQLIDGLRLACKAAQSHKNAPVETIAQKYTKMEDIVQVLFYMGLRMDELLHCRPAWMMNDGRFLRIGDLGRWNLPDEYHPKSQKETDPLIVIPPEVREIFIRRRGQCRGMYERLFGYHTPRPVQTTIKAGCKKAFGADRCAKITPHALRHSCVTYWLNERRIPVQEVQRLVRHQDIKMTMKYYHSNTDSHYAAFHGGQLRKVKDLDVS